MSVEWSEIPEKHPEESLYNAAPIFYDQTEAKKTIEKDIEASSIAVQTPILVGNLTKDYTIKSGWCMSHPLGYLSTKIANLIYCSSNSTWIPAKGSEIAKFPAFFEQMTTKRSESSKTICPDISGWWNFIERLGKHTPRRAGSTTRLREPIWGGKSLGRWCSSKIVVKTRELQMQCCFCLVMFENNVPRGCFWKGSPWIQGLQCLHMLFFLTSNQPFFGDV